jgi:hypothetical protein
MHTYASIADFSGYLTDGSSSTAGPAILKKLEAASRRVDWYCGRSRFGSGFGPRYGTNRYTPDADCPLELWLDDDLLALTSLSIALAVNQTPGSWIEETDFYLAPFDRTPKRKIVAGIPSSALVFAPVMRGTSIVGKWGERDERLTATATMGVIADTTTTTVTPSAVTEFSPGQTLWVGTEMLYVRTVGVDDPDRRSRGERIHRGDPWRGGRDRDRPLPPVGRRRDAPDRRAALAPARHEPGAGVRGIGLRPGGPGSGRARDPPDDARRSPLLPVPLRSGRGGDRLMDTAVIATRLAYIFGGVTPPTNEPAIVLATHELPDELKVDDLPALLVWPPAATPVIQSGMDRSRFRFPVVLYLARSTKTTAERATRIYAWCDALRTLPETVSAHLAVAAHSLAALTGVGSAGGYNVAAMDPADLQYGTVLYDTVRVDVEVVLNEVTVRWQP